jgi:hypothetical protein
MASGANTWFKKLRAIDKRNGLALSKGSFQRRSLASTLDADKPDVPKIPKLIEKVGAHYKPGKLKGGSGCKLNQATRDLIAARREARGAFLRSV